MTFNLRYDNETDGDHRWSLRQSALLQSIRKHKADVIGTQETTDTILTFLKNHFPTYTFVGDGRNSDLQGERCTIMIKSSKFEVLETETVWLNGDLHKAGALDPEEGFARICTMALIQDKKTHQKFRIFNCHKAYQSQIVIQRNGEALLNYILSFKSSHIPFILLGDFNSPIDHPLHQPFVSLFKEAYLTLNQKRPNTFHAFGNPKGIEAIDFIYTDTLTFINVSSDSSQFDSIYPSDHTPLIAELT